MEYAAKRYCFIILEYVGEMKITYSGKNNNKLKMAENEEVRNQANVSITNPTLSVYIYIILYIFETFIMMRLLF
jgi:hypothetical protein